MLQGLANTMGVGTIRIQLLVRSSERRGDSILDVAFNGIRGGRQDIRASTACRSLSRRRELCIIAETSML